MSNAKTPASKKASITANVATSVVDINPIFNFGKYQAKALQSLGTMRENFGDDFSITTVNANWRKYARGKDKSLYIVAELPDGKSTLIGCSQQVSELLYHGDISVSHLVDFPMLVNQYTNRDGEEVSRPIITVPTPEGEDRKQTVHVSQLEQKEFAGTAKTYKAPVW